MKTEVYSWRLSSELKSDLEREARARKVPMSAVLDMAVRQWLSDKRAAAADGEEEQRSLHAEAAKHFGTISGSGRTADANTVRDTIQSRLRRRYGR